MPSRDFDAERVGRPAVTFTVAGREFAVRKTIRPEVLLKYEQYQTESEVLADSSSLDRLDEIVLDIIHHDQAALWMEARHDPDDENCIDLATFVVLVPWLIEQVVSRPTDEPSSSSGGLDATTASANSMPVSFSPGTPTDSTPSAALDGSSTSSTPSSETSSTPMESDESTAS